MLMTSSQSKANLFTDGLWQGGKAYTAYTAWLNTTIPRDFGGLDPFDQRACLVHQRNIFKGAGFPTYNWDIMLNGTVGGRSTCPPLATENMLENTDGVPQSPLLGHFIIVLSGQ